MQRFDGSFRRLDAQEMALWAEAPAALVSDSLGRAQAMDGGMQPLDAGMRLLGQARTVRCAVGDNSALHAALEGVRAGEVLVVDAGGFTGSAVWGGLMTAAARRRGVAGLVVDGAIRDRAEIVVSGFPCFCRGVTPRGPHKRSGGELDAPVACGGVAVSPGDLIVADADGVAVVPLSRIESALAECRALREKEARALAVLRAGGALSAVYGAPDGDRAEGRVL